jgi:alkanesulfonate monooxygenase SsuD/methylene tetrahydromethanopterin reductase-like flavin-dependent oxidoreductase (luciferase family)
MTDRRRGIALTPMETRRDVIVRTALLAEELGYEAFSVPEGWGLDSIPVLTEIALRTRQIRIVSGVLSVWGRSPATLAMTAATLHEISGGRFVLGLGASTRALAEGFHDTPFVQVAARLRATVTRVRALLAGEAPSPASVPTARPIRLGVAPTPDVPIWLAALGDRSVQVVAELADGWLPLFVDRERLHAWARRSSSERSHQLTVAAGPLAVADDDPVAARQVAASLAAWYVAAMGDVYSRSLSKNGYAAEVAAVRAANPRPRPQGGVIPAEAERILDEFTAYGTGSQVRDRLECWDQTVDIVMVGCAPGLPWTMIESTLYAAAPKHN